MFGQIVQTDKVPFIIYLNGYRMVSFNLKVLAKFGLCSNCSQKLDGCSLARARKIFAAACQMLVLAKINTLLECS